MSTNITSDNGVEVEVCGLGIAVVNHEEETETWARLSEAQRVELAAALDPGRRGLHVRLDNQAKTLATFQRERDEALRKKGEMVDRAVRAERERDEWKARAEAAEREASTWRTSTESAHSDFLQAAHDRDEARTRLREVCSTWASAGAAPAPAVDRDVVEATLADGLHRGLTIDQLTRTVCAAIDDDPAVHVVRESDIAAVEVRCEGAVLYAGDWVVRTDMYVAEEWRDKADRYWRSLAETEAVIRAIEAEQAVDPVEAKARELYRAATPDARWETVADEYRRIARHVLGGEQR